MCHPRPGCAQGATEVQSSRKEYRLRPHAGWTGTPSCFGRYAQSADETRTPVGPGQESGCRTLRPHGAGSHQHGASVGATRIAATITSQVSGSAPPRLAPDVAHWHECEPLALPPAWRLRPPQSRLPSEAPGWADHIGSCAGLTTRRPRLRHSTIQARRTATPRTSELVDLAFRPRRASQQATTH